MVKSEFLLPAALVLTLVVLSLALQFNGLYGQDAHEYLRQSRAYFDRLHGVPYIGGSVGDAEFAGGYPLAGALMRFIVGDSIWAMQSLNWLTFGALIWLFQKLLKWSVPGARPPAGLLYAIICVGVSPALIRMGMTTMSDALGLALTLGALLFGLQYLERGRGSDAAKAAAFVVSAVLTRYALGALLAPLAGAIALRLFQRRQWAWALPALGAGLVAWGLHLWMKTGAPQGVFEHGMLEKWSPLHFFSSTFVNGNGTSSYRLPNILYLCASIAHPYLFALLFLLFFGVKRTDFRLPAKQLLPVCLGCYLLLLGGIPHQNDRYLVPAYVLLLLLLFPAWDRFISYGFHFLNKRWMYAILGVFIAMQIVFCFKIMRPVVQRSRLERNLASAIRPVMLSESSPAAALYAFDIDIALKTYLPTASLLNLWERRYDQFPAGSYILFNEGKFQRQWAGSNPMLNWEYAKSNYRIEMVNEFQDGWALFRVGERYK